MTDFNVAIRFNAQTGGITDGVKKIGKGIRKMSDDFANATVKMEKMISAGSHMAQIGSRIANVGKKMARGLAAPIKASIDFEYSMAQVRAVTGAMPKDFKALTDNAKLLGSTTSFSASQAAEGMQKLGMAGFDTNQIMAAMPAMLNLAKGGMLDLGTAADIASDVGAAFKISAEDTARIADVLAKTATSSNTSVQMMGESFKFAAPLAAAAGQSLEMMSAALGTMGNNGIKASVAGTDLATIMKRIADSKVQKKLAAIGVSSLDASGDIKPLTEIMAELSEKTKNMASGERLDFMAKAFGRAGKSAIILSDAAGAGTFQKFNETLLNSAGAAQKMSDVMANTGQGSIDGMNSAIEGLSIAFGDLLAPAFATATKVITTFARFITGFIADFPVLSKVVGVVVGVIAGLAVVLGTLMTTFGSVLGAIAAYNLAMVSTGGVMITFSGIMSTAWAVAFAPLTLIILAVAAVGAAIWFFWDDVKPVFMFVGNIIKNVLVFQFNVLKTVVMGFWNVIKAVFDFIKPAVMFAGEIIGSVLVFQFNVLKTIVVGLWRVFSAFFGQLWSWISDAAGAVTNFMMPVFVKIGEVAGWLGGVFSSAFGLMLEGATIIYGYIESFMMPIFTKLGEWAGALGDVVGAAFGGIADGAMGAFEWVESIVGMVGDAIGAFTVLGTSVGDVWDAVFGPTAEAEKANVSEGTLEAGMDAQQHRADAQKKIDAASGNEKMRLEKELMLFNFKSGIDIRNRAVQDGSLTQEGADRENAAAQIRIKQLESQPAVPLSNNNSGGNVSTVGASTVNVNASGVDAQEVGRIVQGQMTAHEDTVARTMRGSFTDG